MTEEQQYDFQRTIAAFFKSCGIPFEHIEHEALRAAISVLRPDASLPTRAQLESGELFGRRRVMVAKGSHNYADDDDDNAQYAFMIPRSLKY